MAVTRSEAIRNGSEARRRFPDVAIVKAKKTPPLAGFFAYYEDCRLWLNGHDISRCRAFGTVNNIKSDPLTLLQALETLSLDGRMVHKDIFAPILLDKTESL